MAKRPTGDETDWARLVQTELAFRLLSLCGQGAQGAQFLSQALPLLPPGTRLDTRDDRGLTPLMLSCARGDEPAARLLIQAGADIHAEVITIVSLWLTLHHMYENENTDINR